MNEHDERQKLKTGEHNGFQKEKIRTLNKFFMKNIKIGLVVSVLVFLLSVVGLILIFSVKDIDSGLKITLISITATFILTTSKTLIDKIIQIVSYLIVLLSEEQRGINKNIGIEIDKVEFEEMNIEDTIDS